MTPEAQIHLIPLSQIRPSKTNPRKRLERISELAADIRRRGVLQNIIVRHRGDGYEIVAGERRWRAAKEAGLRDIPASVRELSDAEAYELQLVENSQREDIHPMEEAEGYRTLCEVHGLSIEEIAARVGKSVSTVRQRLWLCGLVPEVREAFLADEITAGVAFIIARIPQADMQRKALAELRTRKGEDPVSARDASWTVQRKFMLRLADAPFDCKDASLVEGAPACTSCTRATGNQRELFAELSDKENLCTDPACFEAKKTATWKLRATEAKKKGHEVLDGKKAKEIFTYGRLASKEYVDLADSSYGADGKARKNAVLLGKAKGIPRIVARDDNGVTHELVHANDFRAAAKAAGHDLPSRSAYGLTPKQQAEEKARKAKEKEEKEKAARELSELMEAAATKTSVGPAVWPVLATALVRMVWSDVVSEMCKLLGLDAKKGNGSSSKEEALTAAIAETTPERARGIAFALAVAGARHGREKSHADLRLAFGLEAVKAVKEKRRKKAGHAA